MTVIDYPIINTVCDLDHGSSNAMITALRAYDNYDLNDKHETSVTGHQAISAHNYNIFKSLIG